MVDVVVIQIRGDHLADRVDARLLRFRWQARQRALQLQAPPILIGLRYRLSRRLRRFADSLARDREINPPKTIFARLIHRHLNSPCLSISKPLREFLPPDLPAHSSERGAPGRPPRDAAVPLDRQERTQNRTRRAALSAFARR